MSKREKFYLALSVLAVGLFGILFGRWLALRQINAPITLKIAFDGGYTFDFERSDAVNVDALTKANYPMKVRVLTTSGMSDIDMTGYKLSLLPDGSAPSRSKPALPPDDPTQVGCTVETDVMKKNNRLFIPNLADVATRMGTTIKSNRDIAATVELTGGGELSVDELGGCVQFYDQMNQPINALPKRSMASGIGGIVFEWPHIAWQKVVLQQTPLGGGTPILTDITPNASNVIILRVSSFAAPTTTAPAPHLITHFKDHFDDVFTAINESKRISLWWLGTYLTSPGIDCPGGGI